ncbi:MAG: VWA domain-containing protein [Phycisphaerae bacterium]|nr:VWA domain-containing protein [Phycisphaerae bacterium]
MKGKDRVVHRRDRGVAVAQTAIVTTMLGFGAAALAVDTGLMFTARAELQTVADAAALAAAAELGMPDGLEGARQKAVEYAEMNQVAFNGLTINPYNDVVFGRAVPDVATGKFTFQPGQQPYDAVKITARRDATAADGPLHLLFSTVIGGSPTNVSASAVAMLMPRDIAMVIDLSGSMNDDSELQHYTTFLSDNDGSPLPGVNVNLKDIWIGLPIQKGNNGVGNGIDPAPPGNPTNYNDQPGTGPGSPNSQGGNPDPGAEPLGGSTNPAGPRWGWMTGWGMPLDIGVYVPETDHGLYYIPRSQVCTDPDVITNITEAGYSLAERTALLSGTYDGNSTIYYNRVRCLLGLAGWKSKKSGGKYNGGPGNGDNRVDSNELTQQAGYAFNQGSWGQYIAYVSSNTSEMYRTDPNFRYRFGIKTVVNYHLETRPSYAETPELSGTPEQPLQAVKDAVHAMVDRISSNDWQDQMSLEIFGTTARHEVNLTADVQSVWDRLAVMQANHYDGTTNIGGGMNRGILELQSQRARPTASKVIVLMTDGKPNIDQYGNYVGNGAPAAVNWALDRAQYAAQQNMRIYTVTVGHDADRDLCEQIARTANGESFYASGNPDEYVGQLLEIFETISGKRPVQLIQ